MGDLDNILFKALKRKPEERYQTAAAFADDLNRYLTHQPVSARPDSWTYRARKFGRRHRAGLSAVALVTVSLVGGTFFATRQMRIAERQRDRAQDALKRSAASVSFEATLFRVLDRGRSYTYEELMDLSRQAIEREFRADPIARIQIGIQFAQLYLRSDSSRAAYAMLDRSRMIADSVGRPEWQGRTRCELAASVTQSGHPDSAIALVRQGRGFLKGVRDLERGALNACDNNAADAWLRLNRPDSAAPAYERAAARFRADGDTLTEMYVYALNNNARVLFGLRRLREAGVVIARLLDLSRQGNTADPMSRVNLIQNADILNQQLGEHRASLALLAGALGDSTGIDSVAARAAVLHYRYAMVLQRIGDADSARIWVDRALADEAGLGAPGAVSAHTLAADLAFRRGDGPGFALHRSAVERLGLRLDTKAARELGFLRLLAMTEGGDSLAPRIAAVLDASGFGPGRPRQDRLIDHLLVAAERLNAAGRYGDAVRYAAAVLETAAVDSLTWTRSGVVGAALYQRARGELGQGDAKAARASLRAADAPLRFGFGPGHRLVSVAAAFRDSIGR
jgi:serine/threonine-protein kinase